MMTISLCMIVRNEEKVLGRCLECGKVFADEIIVVDTGSQDRTREIAEEYGAKVYGFSWQDDFAAARNAAFDKASMDYCMWLDADDVVTEENQKRLVELKETLDKNTDMVMMRYVTAEDEDGNPLFSYYRERLVKNGKGFRWEGRVHEVITPSGNVAYSGIEINHRKQGPGDGDRNLRIYERMIQEGEELTGRSLFYYGRELMAHKRYEEARAVMEAFLDGAGWVENQIEACLNLAECQGALGHLKEAAQALLRSFLYDLPRGEACFGLGRYFQELGQWAMAVYWYKEALASRPEAEHGGFIRWDYYGYLPEVNLCLCYDRMGERDKAYEYHKKAKAWRPDSQEVQWNETYFRGLGYQEPG